MWAGQDDTQRYKTRVLKPPGGGSSDIFGAAPEETSPRRVKNHNQSQLGSALFGDGPNTGNNEPSSRSTSKPDGNPVTGTGYSPEAQNNGQLQNGTSSSSSEKSSDSSPASKAPPRTRVPPGGYSSGLW